MKLRPLLLLLAFASCRLSPVSLPNFQELPSPVAEDLSAIAFSDSLNGSLTGGKAWEFGFVLNTGDGGFTWHTDTTFDWKMEHVCFDALGQGYACGQNILLFRPSGEERWRFFQMDFKWLRACHFPDGKRGTVVGGEGYHGGLARSYGPVPFWKTDSLQNFPNEIESVWYSDSLTIHAVGFGWAMRSVDAGRSWERLGITGDFFQSVHFPTPSTGYFCGSSGSIYKTTDGGQSWKCLRKPGALGKQRKPFRSLRFATAEKGWIVGDNGIFWQTDNGGDSWHPVEEAPTDADFTDVFLLGKKGWVAAKRGRLFAFDY